MVHLISEFYSYVVNNDGCHDDTICITNVSKNKTTMESPLLYSNRLLHHLAFSRYWVLYSGSHICKCCNAIGIFKQCCPFFLWRDISLSGYVSIHPLENYKPVALSLSFRMRDFNSST